ncbi:hypothetical protein [Pseudomonas cerasi]
MSQLISGYEQEFHDAIERTDSWGLCAPYFKASDKRYIDENSLQKLTEYLDVFFQKTDMRQLSQQCLAANFSMQRQIEKLLGTPLIYTLGYIEHYQNNIFYTPEEHLKEQLHVPVALGPVNLHAWLTSPSYEIIDLTLSTTLGVASDTPALIGSVIAKHHSLFPEDLVHHPQFVGTDFLSAIGQLIYIGEN